MHAIDEFAPKPVKDIIDLGTADGRMLAMIYQKHPEAHCVGVELDPELASFGKATFPHLEIFHGDIQSLEFSDDSFDVVIAAAVIEHVPDPRKVMRETRRILRREGIFILTSPDPLWECLATRIGHLEGRQHNKVMTLRQLSELATKSGFAILKTQKFMLSPVGLPFELSIEKCMRRLHLDFVMANQLLVARF